jgi:hypothetical protein
MPKLTFLFQCREQAAENAPGTRMPWQAFTRKTKIILTSSWQSDCLSPQAFCHLAGHVLGSAKSVALRRRGSHANCWLPASFYADAGLDSMLGPEPLRQQARPGANLAHQNGLLGNLSRRDRTLLG